MYRTVAKLEMGVCFCAVDREDWESLVYVGVGAEGLEGFLGLDRWKEGGMKVGWGGVRG